MRRKKKMSKKKKFFVEARRPYPYLNMVYWQIRGVKELKELLKQLKEERFMNIHVKEIKE